MEYTALYYYGYRFYDPELGRWLSRDPIGEAGGTGLYVSVNNGPLSVVDYLGLLGSAIGFYGVSPTGAFGWGSDPDGRYGYEVRFRYQLEKTIKMSWPWSTPLPKVKGWILADVSFKASGKVAKRSDSSSAWSLTEISEESQTFTEFIVIRSRGRTDLDKHTPGNSETDNQVICEASVTEDVSYGFLDPSTLDEKDVTSKGILFDFGFVTGTYKSVGDGYLLKGPPRRYEPVTAAGRISKASKLEETAGSFKIVYEYAMSDSRNRRLGCPCRPKESGATSRDHFISHEGLK